MHSLDHQRVALALRALAADPALAEGFRNSAALRDALRPAAARYVLAAEAGAALQRLALLDARGYALGLEWVGENARDEADVARAVQEYQQLLQRMPLWPAGARRREINFDLSRLGLAWSPELAHDAALTIARAALGRGLHVTLSMEGSALVDATLRCFRRLAKALPNIGLTLQAHLHRSPADLPALQATGCRLRLVKGIYREPLALALPRGAALDARYLALAAALQRAGQPYSLATHDGRLLARLLQRRLFDGGEAEMLHGVRPGLLRALRERGVACRVYAVYGDDWYLHLLHRLAECPPMLFQALGDIAEPQRVVFGKDY